MISKLRPYQVEALNNIRASIRGGVRRLVVQAPPGAGKTKISAAIVDGCRSKNNRVAFVCPAISLIDQTVESFYAEGIRDIGVIQANHEMTDWSRPVQVCSIQTIQSRGAFPAAQTVLFDECHKVHKAMIAWLKHPDWRNVPMIGLSATPWTKGLGKYFDSLLVAATTKELIEQGYLSPLKVFASGHPDLSNVKVVAGDYHEGQLSMAMQSGELTADIIKTWREKWGKGKTLCFGVDKAHAKSIQERFEYVGIRCGYQDAETTPDERREIKRKFHNGEYEVVSNIQTLTTGVDWDVRCLILARPTRSEMLYCLDSETEILTSHGWKGIDQAKVGDCAATMSDLETSAGKWSPIIAVVARQMEASERWVEYNAPRANFRVTDQHRMIHGRPYQISPAIDIAGRNSSVFMPTAVHMGQVGVPLTDAELYFIGMMMSDGTWGPARGAISQSERHPDVIQRIEDCLKTIGIYFSKKLVTAGGGFTERYKRWIFSISAGKPRSNAVKWGGITGYRHLLPYMDKDFSPALMAMSKTQLDKFLQGLWDGDGAKKKNVEYEPKSMEICSARPEMMDKLQALCSINGYTANLRKEQSKSRPNPIWIITITPKDWRSCGGYSAEGRGERPKIILKEHTDERVWCVETETGTIVTRRRGKVTVMGNCQIIGRALRTAPGKDCSVILDHTDTTTKLGLVTDIHHDHLDDGKIQQKEKQKEKLPKECPQCHMIKKAKKCPNCGYEAVITSNIMEQDGELVEFSGGKKGKGKSREMTSDEKRLFLSELKCYCIQHGYKSGWAANKYKDRLKVWPHHSIADVPPAKMVSPTTALWIRSRAIAFSKKKKIGVETGNPRA